MRDIDLASAPRPTSTDDAWLCRPLSSQEIEALARDMWTDGPGGYRLPAEQAKRLAVTLHELLDRRAG